MNRALTAQEERASRLLSQHLVEELEQLARSRDGVARQSQWHAEDGWIIVYTTSRIQDGPHDGRFLTQAFKPVGPGSKSGKAESWVVAYERAFSTRKAAKDRALALYAQHSPKWAAKHGRGPG